MDDYTLGMACIEAIVSIASIEDIVWKRLGQHVRHNAMINH